MRAPPRGGMMSLAGRLDEVRSYVRLDLPPIDGKAAQ